jgi:hypothetical protein
MTPEWSPSALPALGGQAAWFVYYRVDPENLERAVLAVQQRQQRLRGGHPGLQTALMRRSDLSPGPATLMELYVLADANPPGLPGEALVREIEATMSEALQGLLAGQRHSEGFMPCA